MVRLVGIKMIQVMNEDDDDCGDLLAKVTTKRVTTNDGDDESRDGNYRGSDDFRDGNDRRRWQAWSTFGCIGRCADD